MSINSHLLEETLWSFALKYFCFHVAVIIPSTILQKLKPAFATPDFVQIAAKSKNGIEGYIVS